MLKLLVMIDLYILFNTSSYLSPDNWQRDTSIELYHPIIIIIITIIIVIIIIIIIIIICFFSIWKYRFSQ